MFRNIITALTLLFSLVSASYAFPINGYFRQGWSIENYTSESILVTDTATVDLNNYNIIPNNFLTLIYSSDQFTNTAGQTFSHTAQINSINNQPICTITTKITISLTSETFEKPTNSNPTRCITSNMITTSLAKGRIYTTNVIVQ